MKKTRTERKAAIKRPETSSNPRFGQGGEQFVASKKVMLDLYDAARIKAGARRVETLHGETAEVAFREWLAEFLPKRYGVTSGYIVSQRLSEPKLPHYDVIIYDQMESPVLWKENSETGHARSRAIPVEHVHAVLEIKSAFRPSSVEEALVHLAELDSLSEGTDAAGERYPQYLPSGFFRAAIFFELRDSDRRRIGALKKFVRTAHRSGYFNSLILRGDGHPSDYAGTIEILCSEDGPLEQGTDLLGPFCFSKNEMIDGSYYAAFLTFSVNGFANFCVRLGSQTERNIRIRSFVQLSRHSP